MKKCAKCGVVSDNFGKAPRMKSGLKSYCRPCSSSVSNKTNQKRRLRRRQMLDRLLVKFGCTDCGYNDNPLALEWDHVDPKTKSGKVGDFMMSTLKRLFEEIRKCQVRCANCHSIKSRRESRRL